MDLGVFELDKPGLLAWLHADHRQRSRCAAPTGWTGWDPLEVGAEAEVIELLEAVQRERLLTGPAQVGLIYRDDPGGDTYYVTVDITSSEHRVLRLASIGCDWSMIAPGAPTGADAAAVIMDGITAEANALLRHLKGFAAPYEQAAHDRAMEESLQVTDGIDDIDTCGCGDPIALYDGEWCHVYNDRLRGTDDHDPVPG
jgi:hypothetical protein